MNKVIVRSLSGIVYIGAIVGCILWGEWAFCILTILFTIIAEYEYFIMAHAPYGDKQNYIPVLSIDMLFAALLPLTSMLGGGTLQALIMVLGSYFLVRAIYSLTDKGEHAFREVAKSVMGVIYIGLPMLMLNMLYQNAGVAGKWLTLLMFITIWLNDTGAFCFGCTLGKHRLCERLSPKKSWEGFWGGMGCSIVFGGICYYFFNEPGFALWQWLLLGAIISLFATWGDLFESMLKRTVKVKDSGSLIPGHGGILDRIDSLLFVAPITLIFVLCL